MADNASEVTTVGSSPGEWRLINRMASMDPLPQTPQDDVV
jgi:hypothetical protein